MKQLNLRFHHLMCCYTFTGVGYNDIFTKNMENIVQILKENFEIKILLQTQCDDLCAQCPHNKNGSCDTEDSVRRRDLEVAEYFGIKSLKHLTIDEYRTRILPVQKQLRSIDEVCRKCTFSELCNRVLSEKNS